MNGNRRIILLAIIFWSALAIFETWPLIANLNTHIFGFPGDPFFKIRAFHIASERLEQGLPFKWFWLGTHLPTFLPGVALTRLFSAVVAYNVLMLLSFPLAGLTMFFLAHYITRGEKLVSLVAATAYAFCPYHLAHATAHLDLSHIEWLPLVFLFLLRCADRPSARNIALLICSYLLTLLGNYYYGFFTALAALAFVIADLLCHLLVRANVVGRAKNYARTLIAPAVIAAVSLPFAWQFITHRLWYARDIRDVFRFAARLRDYVVPSPPFSLFGGPFAQFVALRIHKSYQSEQSLFLGFTILAFAAYALFCAVRYVGAVHEPPTKNANQNTKGRFVNRPYEIRPAAAALAFALCALSCFIISFPPVIEAFGLQIKTPAYYLYFLAPMFRFYSRMGVLVELCVIAVATYGLMRVGRAFQPAVHRVLITLAFCAILAEVIVLPGTNLTSVAPRPVDQFLAGLPDSGKVLDILPETPNSYAFILFEDRLVSVPLVQTALLHQLTHKKPIIAPIQLLEADITAREDYTKIQKLRSLGVKYIVFEGGGILFASREVLSEQSLVTFYRNSRDVRLMRQFGTDLLFEILPPKLTGPKS
ncbi:MAG TPA: YfhO family protein [bacterium]|nr:YfhO family protein [bacterium]